MKPLLALMIAALIALSGTTLAFAKEQPEASQTATDASKNSNGGNELGQQYETTQPVTTQPTEPKKSTTPKKAKKKKKKTVINGEFKSKDKNFKLYLYNNGKLKFADIIKYIGKDKFPESYTIKKIDGYKIRRIRSKAFSNLKTLRKVTFKGSIFNKKHYSYMAKYAFYNCKNMSSFSTSSFVTMRKNCVGYYKDKPSKNFTKLIINDKTLTKTDVSSKLKYADNSEAKAVINISKNNTDNRKAEIVDFLNGTVFYAGLGGKFVKGWKSSDPKVISITNSGKAVVLTKGKTTLSVKSGKLKIKRAFTVTKNPYLAVKSKKVTSVKIKNGKSLSVEVMGKADNVDNEYTDTEYAEINGETTSETIKIKASRRGNTNVKVKVNGKNLKLDVTVQKNPIKDEKMEKISNRVGHQSQYYYSDSSVMCSAYAYAYTYWQVTGQRITPGSVWGPGGCNWAGGINRYFGTKKSMLKAIKTSLDKNESCVGLVTVGNSAHHYVTFYDYKGKGKSLSDYKILDPWDGNLTTGYGYGYSYDYQVITVDN